MICLSKNNKGWYIKFNSSSFVYTIESRRIGFRPYRSDAIPHKVEEKNWRREKSEPIIPPNKTEFHLASFGAPLKSWINWTNDIVFP